MQILDASLPSKEAGYFMVVAASWSCAVYLTGNGAPSIQCVHQISAVRSLQVSVSSSQLLSVVAVHVTSNL